MMKKLTLLLFYICLLTVNQMSSQNYPKQKYGIFVHYGYGGTGEYGCQITPYSTGIYPQNVDETANNFDVQGFANNIAAMKPEYLIFTAWHCGMYPLYPSAKMDQWLGTGHCSQRDVLQEVLDACDAKGIDVYFYIQPSEAHDFTPAEQAKVGYVNQNTKAVTYNNFINEVIAELTTRYKSQFKGFWFDKGLSYGCTDRPRIGKTVRAIMPNAVLIANTFANESADYGAVETKNPVVTFERDGYTGVSMSDEKTWPAYERSISFVSDASWAAQPGGSIRYTSEKMFKYTVLEAGVNEEGGGVAWAIGPYPTTTISWNNGILAGMTGLGTLIDAVSESIKSTVPSNSWPTAEGTRIQELTWGVATRSANSNYEYLHVLKAPTGKTLTIAAPADGREYTAAVNLRTGKSCAFSQTVSQVVITLNASDSWDSVDTVIKLTAKTSVNETATNLAPFGIATQSTTAYSGLASRAIDKNTSGVYTDNSVSHTGAASGEWWMVTLANSYTISSIKVFNRTDAAYVNRLNNFTVQVLNSSNQIVFTQTITNTPNPSVTLTIPSVVGNRVRIIQNNATTALALAEVEVYGASGTTLSTNSALDKDKNLFSISPNPVIDILNIKLETTKSASYRVFDTNGQLLLIGTINNGAAAVDLSHLAHGIYILKVSNGTTVATQKIIKE